jgi:hypothetical protein
VGVATEGCGSAYNSDGKGTVQRVEEEQSDSVRTARKILDEAGFGRRKKPREVRGVLRLGRAVSGGAILGAFGVSLQRAI